MAIGFWMNNKELLRLQDLLHRLQEREAVG